MIRYGLKLWTNNRNLFEEAFSLYQKKSFDFIELYHNAHEEIDFGNLMILKEVPVIIHNTHDSGFHELEISEKQLNIWEKTKQLAEYFQSPYIIVHPGKALNFYEFQKKP